VHLKKKTTQNICTRNVLGPQFSVHSCVEAARPPSSVKEELKQSLFQ